MQMRNLGGSTASTVTPVPGGADALTGPLRYCRAMDRWLRRVQTTIVALLLASCAIFAGVAVSISDRSCDAACEARLEFYHAIDPAFLDETTAWSIDLVQYAIATSCLRDMPISSELESEVQRACDSYREANDGRWFSDDLDE